MTTIYYVKCDICGRELKSKSFPWEEGSTDVDFNSWGFSSKISREICPRCFKFILIPFIDKQKEYFEKYKNIEVDAKGNVVDNGEIKIDTKTSTRNDTGNNKRSRLRYIQRLFARIFRNE